MGRRLGHPLPPLKCSILSPKALKRAEQLLKEKRQAASKEALRPRELERRKERLAAKLLRGSRRKLWRQ
jgi:hypothetical protein